MGTRLISNHVCFLWYHIPLRSNREAGKCTKYEAEKGTVQDAYMKQARSQDF